MKKIVSSNMLLSLLFCTVYLALAASLLTAFLLDPVSAIEHGEEGDCLKCIAGQNRRSAATHKAAKTAMCSTQLLNKGLFTRPRLPFTPGLTTAAGNPFAVKFL